MRFSRNRAKRQILTVRTTAIAVIIVGVAAFAWYRLADRETGPDERVALAECLTANDAAMYGAYWCPHCQRQKKLFGAKAWPKVDYVECAIPGNRLEQTEECKQMDISGYPTWIFADGTRWSGEKSLEELAEKAGCAYGNVTAAEDAGDGTDAEGADEPVEAGSAMPVPGEDGVVETTVDGE